MAKGATSKKKREEENRQESQQRQNTQQREETRQRQQRTRGNSNSSQRQSQSRNDRADSRQTTRREVAPAAIPVLEERLTPRRSASGRNVAEMFPEYEPQQAATIPVVQPIPTTNKGQGFQADLDQRMRDYYNNGTPIARHTAERAQETAEQPETTSMPVGTDMAEKGRKDAQRRAEAQAVSAPIYNENGLTEAAQKEVDDLNRRIEKLSQAPLQNERQIAALKDQVNEIYNNRHASSEDYLVSRDQYDTLMQDKELANDISNLTQIIYNPRRAGGKASADAVAERLTNGQMDSEGYYSYLEDKYGLSRAELEDMALTRHSDDRAGYSQEYGEKAAKFGEKNPVLGSALSLVDSIGNAVEGGYNTLVGALTDDNRRFSRGFNATKTGLREGVKENIGPEILKGAYDIGMGLGDLGVGVATGNAPLLLAGNTANEAVLGADAKGQSARKAATYGALSGVADYYFNKVGLDKAKELALQSVKSSGIKKMLTNMGIAGLGEAGENVLQDITQSFLDEFINGNRSDLRTSFADKVASGMTEDQAFSQTALEYAKQLGISGLTGFAMGAAMQGGHTLKNEVEAGLANRILNGNSERVNAKVDEWRKNQVPQVEQAETPEMSLDELGEQLNPIDTLDINKIDFDAMDVERQQAIENIENLAKQATESDALVQLRDTVTEQRHSILDQINTSNLHKYQRNAATDAFNNIERGLDNAESWMITDAKNVDNLKDYIHFYINQMAKNGVKVDDTFVKAVDDYLDEIKALKFSNNNASGAGIKQITNEVDNLAKQASETSAEESVDDFKKLLQEYDRNNLDADLNELRQKAIDEFTQTTKQADEVAPEVNPEMPSVQAEAKKVETPKLDNDEQQLFNDLSTGYDGSRDWWKETLDKAQEYINNGGDVEKASRVIGEIERLERESKELIDLGGTPTWSMPRPSQQLDGVAARINDTLNKVSLEDETIAKEADNIRKAIDNYRTSLEGDNLDAINQARKDLYNACKRFDTRAKKITLEGYDGLFGKKSFSYNTPQSMGVGSPQKLWQNIADAEENNQRLLSGEEPEDTLGKLLNGETLEEPAKPMPVAETPNVAQNEVADIPKMTEPEMAEVVDEIPTVNAAQAESDDITRLVNNFNDPYVPDPNAIQKNQLPEQPGSRNSKLGTNTMRTLDGDAQNAEDLSRGLYSYVPKEEQETMRIGAKRVLESPNKAYNDILNTADDAFTSEDVDTSMMLRNKIKQDLALAKNSGDTQTANYLQSQLDALTIRQRKAATNAGQVSQAWAKWSRDADGATFAAYNIAARQYEDALKNNPKLGEMMHESTEELWNQLVNADLDKESVESLSDQIQDMLRSIIDKNGNYKIKRNFQEANIKKLSDTLAMQMKQNEDISETLDMIEQAGVTGFTGLDDSIEQEVRELFDQAEMFGYKSRQRFELENQAYAKLARALNLTGGIYEKADTIRYFAMLANPKTHLRNIAGNYTWGEITNFKDQLAGLLEEAVDRASLKKGARAAEQGIELKHGGQGIDRTNVFIRKNGADRNLYNASLDDFEENAFTDLVGNKYTTAAQGIEGNKNVFGYGKVGSAASDTANANSSILELEDIAAKRRKYADSLTRYLKANGYDESILKSDITDRKTLEFLEEARSYAKEQAEKATFNQNNWLADKLSKFSQEARDINWSEEGAGKRAHKLAGLFLDATVPFKRTPMNIVTSLWDYQPIHLARFGVDIADIARHKPKAVNKLIDDLAKEATGAGLLAAGWGLAKSGFITGREDEETGELDALTGKQDYSLNLGPLGSYTLDWLSPSLTILLAGANLAQSGLSAEGFTQMIADIGEPVLETTMLSSLVDVLRSAQYAEDEMDTIKQAGATAVKNYATQFIPTELGNIARSIDNTRRSTYTDKTGVRGIADRTLKSIMNKIPGLSEMSQPYINKWGDEEQNYKGPGSDNLAARLAYNHLSPGYYSNDNTTVKDEYLYNLYDQLEQKDPEIFPQAFSTKVSEGGVQRKITPEEKTMKDTVEGNARDSFITAMANSEEIRSLPPETQAAIAKDMYEVAKLAGNASIIDGHTSTNKGYNTYLAGQQSKEGRTGVEDLLRYEIQKYTMKDAGISTSSNVSNTLGEMLITDPERARQLTDNVATLVNAGVSSAGQDTYVKRGINFLGDIDPTQYADTWNAINSSEGNTDKITQTELKDYFADKKVTNQEKMFELWGAYLTDFDPGADSYTVPYLKDDGTIGTHTATDDERKLMQSIIEGDDSSEQKTSEAQPHTLPVMNVNLNSSSESEPEPMQETTQSSQGSGDWLDRVTGNRPQTEEIPSVQGNAQYNTIDDVYETMRNSNIDPSGAAGYWKQASSNGATPQQFYEYYNAIDSALGKPNGGISIDEWVKYLNDNGYDYKKDLEILDMLYNTRWTRPNYNDGTWSR